MTDETKPTEVLEPEPPKQRRLLRSRNDRMIAGVAGGLADYFAVDPVIIRIGFAISVFFGGLGALAYLALVLFVPVGDEGEVTGEAAIESSRGLAIGAGIGLAILALSLGIFDADFLFGGDGWWIGTPLLLLAAIAIFVTRRREASTVAAAVPAEGGTGTTATTTTTSRPVGRSALGIAAGIVLAFFGVAALGAIAIASAWAGATGHGVAIAAAVIAIGVLLALSAFRGHGARWLIVPAVALAAPLATVSAADISFGDGVGEREYRPVAIAALPADGYELGIGHLLVDLRDLDWEEDTVVDLDVDLGIGQAIVAVPENVCVAADIDATAGHLDVAGSDSDGVDPEIDRAVPSESTPRLNLNGEVDLGEFLVINDDDLDIDEFPRRWRNHGETYTNDSELEARMDAACASGPTPTSGEPAGPKPPADPAAPGGEAEEAGGTSGIRGR